MTPALSLYYHPLASYCWKVLIALYENDTLFAPRLVDLSDEAQRNGLLGGGDAFSLADCAAAPNSI